jgi:type II secretory pathway pseudopilin PulG
MRLRRQNGDTIVEVLFAITVFALVAVGSMAIMNQGIASAQRSLEITLVRQQIDAQAEAIRYIHKAYIDAYQRDSTAPTGTAAEWDKMTSKTTGKGASSPSEFGVIAGGVCPSATPGEKPFILNARKAIIHGPTPSMVAPVGASVPPYAQVIYNSDSSINATYGLWVEAIPSTGTDGPGFVDFHIRACWETAGSTIPSNLGTIVRLYEPR